MTLEEKQLLLIDLCARLPYSPFVQLMEKFDDEDSEHFREIHNLSTYDIELFNSGEISNIKPYLRPMSSMTKEEEDELCELCTLSDCDVNEEWELCGVNIIQSHPKYGTYFSTDYSVIDWLNKKMFDYRGLIGEGLAIEVTEENNPYKD